MATPAPAPADVELELSWSEQELPERERTKHVHRLHPYLGKFVPQLAETFLRRYVRPGGLVWDPFAGSGTTLVEANAFGARAAGCDVSAFNCLLMRVKTAAYEPDLLLGDLAALFAAASFRAGEAGPGRSPSGTRRGAQRTSGPSVGSSYLERWFAPQALAELVAFRERISETAYPDLWRVVLSRAARSARLARHDDLDFPKEPVRRDYFCHKHRRVCRPVGEASKFLRRYARDAVRRVREFADVRTGAPVRVVHGDARAVDPPSAVDLLLTSPPYPGFIDYHDQHAYAYELLGLERRDGEEIGRSVRGYCDDVAAVLRRGARALRTDGRVVVVVNDSRGLYDAILPAAALRLEQRLRRRVNRRTGRRNGAFYEDVLIATP